MNEPLETDYLVVGTGAAGMAFTDALLAHTPDATVTMVDRRHAPGGHWIDAYPFVRLHQPSAFYGVASVPLGRGAVDRTGVNAGFHEAAGRDELRAYFSHVMDQHFLPTGRVRHHPCTGYSGADGRHWLTSRLTGEVREVRVRRKLVDTTYLEGRVPATSPPPFEVADGVRWVPAGGVTRLVEPPARYAVIGGGKTALDTCVWLLSQGVPAAKIQWVRPRDGWWLNRRYHQPGEGMPEFFAGIGLQLQAMAQASTIDDLCARLEADGFLLRIDPSVPPAMLHGAIASEAEMALLRQIQDVVRLGHVQRIERDHIVLEHGSVPTTPDTLHVHCAAVGLARPPLRPIFEPGRITIQPIFWGFACFPFALLGVVEATMADDTEKNRLCPPVPYWDTPRDYVRAYLALLANERARAAYPAVAAWAKATHLNPMAGLGAHRGHPLVTRTWEQVKQHGAAAAANLARLLG